MSKKKKWLAVAAAAWAVMGAGSAQASIRITEWMYQGQGAGLAGGEVNEFIEFTNVGLAAVDMTGWRFSDSARGVPAATLQNLSAFGIVQPGESVILTEVSSAATFRTRWGLPATVKVIAGLTQNLGRSDEVNLYDASTPLVDALVDRLTYNDEASPSGSGGPRTRWFSGNIPLTHLDVQGLPKAAGAVLSSVGDSYESWMSSNGDVGNPGKYTPFTPVPEPTSVALAGLAFVAFGAMRRRVNG